MLNNVQAVEYMTGKAGVFDSQFSVGTFPEDISISGMRLNLLNGTIEGINRMTA